MDVAVRVRLPLLLLRLGVFVVMFMWTLDKFLNPNHAAAIFDKFYQSYSGALSPSFLFSGGRGTPASRRVHSWLQEACNLWNRIPASRHFHALVISTIPFRLSGNRSAFLRCLAHACRLLRVVHAAGPRHALDSFKGSLIHASAFPQSRSIADRSVLSNAIAMVVLTDIRSEFICAKINALSLAN